MPLLSDTILTTLSPLPHHHVMTWRSRTKTTDVGKPSASVMSCLQHVSNSFRLDHSFTKYLNFLTEFPGVHTAHKPAHSHSSYGINSSNGPWINDEKCPQQNNGKGNGSGGSNKECCYVQPDVGSTIHFNILINKNTHTCTATGSSEI